jgi:hypothetical protein
MAIVSVGVVDGHLVMVGFVDVIVATRRVATAACP